MAVEILRKGNTYKFESILNLNGAIYADLGTATVVKCALAECATGTNVLEVPSTDANVVLDDGAVGTVGWTLTPAQTALLNNGLHSLAIQVESPQTTYEWVEEKIVNVKPEYISV